MTTGPCEPFDPPCCDLISRVRWLDSVIWSMFWFFDSIHWFDLIHDLTCWFDLVLNPLIESPAGVGDVNGACEPFDPPYGVRPSTWRCGFDSLIRSDSWFGLLIRYDSNDLWFADWIWLKSCCRSATMAVPPELFDPWDPPCGVLDSRVCWFDSVIRDDSIKWFEWFYSFFRSDWNRIACCRSRRC